MSITDEKRFCGQCGSERKQIDQFCGQCGCSFQAADVATPTNEVSRKETREFSKPRNKSRLSRLVGSLLGLIALGCLIAFLLVPKFMNPSWPAGDWVYELRPGKTTLSEIADQYGEYESVGTYGNNFEKVTYLPNADGIQEFTVWLDAARIVRWARIIPMNSPTQKQVRKSLFMAENSFAMSPGNRLSPDKTLPGDTFHLSYGRFLYVVGEEVKEIWKVDVESMGFDYDIDQIVLEMYGAPNRKLDVSGKGFPIR